MLMLVVQYVGHITLPPIQNCSSRVATMSRMQFTPVTFSTQGTYICRARAYVSAFVCRCRVCPRVSTCDRVCPRVFVCPRVTACVHKCSRVTACVLKYWRVTACVHKCSRVTACPQVFACVRMCP